MALFGSEKRDKSRSLKVGSVVPRFSALSSAGDPVVLDELLQLGRVVISFFPKAFTPVCTQQACALKAGERSPAPELAAQQTGLSVVGISPDDAGTQERFRKEKHLPYPLIPDTHLRLFTLFEVWVPFTRVPGRATFLVEGSGKIVTVSRSLWRAGAHGAVLSYGR